MTRAPLVLSVFPVLCADSGCRSSLTSLPEHPCTGTRSAGVGETESHGADCNYGFYYLYRNCILCNYVGYLVMDWLDIMVLEYN